MSQPTVETLDLSRAAGTWRPRDGVGHVGFEVKTMWGLATVKGRFEKWDGVLRLGPDAPSAELTIEAASLDTGHAKRDKHLRSADFFDTERHPAISFRSHEVVPHSNPVTIAGELEIGEAKIPVNLSVEVAQDDPDALIVRTSTTVSRHDAKLAWNKLGMFRGDAKLKIEVELFRSA
jgi:polyisoprenoid-binding protein YceI